MNEQSTTFTPPRTSRNKPVLSFGRVVISEAGVGIIARDYATGVASVHGGDVWLIKGRSARRAGNKTAGVMRQMHADMNKAHHVELFLVCHSVLAEKTVRRAIEKAVEMENAESGKK